MQSQINQDKLLLTAGGNKQNLLIVINLFGREATQVATKQFKISWNKLLRAYGGCLGANRR
jgi:hypothetical protein